MTIDWQRKKILITGAGGFIGSHLVERVVKLGGQVRAFVRYNSRNDWGLLELLPKDVLGQVEIFPGDLKDPEAVRGAIRGCQIIFHLGALIAVPFSYRNPRDFIDTNVVGTANVCNAALEYGIEKMVHTSTSEVYGTARSVPITEGHPLQAQSPYAGSKIGADKLVESYHLSFGLPVATIRPFNTYGARQSARAVIPAILIQALSRDRVFIGASHPVRDFTYIDDTVEGFLKVAESPRSIGEVINVGSGDGVTVEELSRKIINLVGRQVEVVVDPERFRPEASEVALLIADIRKAKDLIGWEPRVPLQEGLKKTIGWFAESLAFYKSELYNV